MARPNHFEIPVDDPDRAEKFYGDIFGWTFQRFEGAPSYYGMANTGPDDKGGINGALFARSDVNVVSLTMEVDSIEDSLASVRDKGGQVVQEKTPIPGMGFFATCKDTEGNLFGLFTSDESASMSS